MPRLARCTSRCTAAGASVIALLGIGLPVASPAAAGAFCRNGQPDASPASNGEQLIAQYFQAINDQDYLTAWGYLSTRLRGLYDAPMSDREDGGLSHFSATMRQHVKCVRAVTITNVPTADPDVSASMGMQWYRVTFDVEYGPGPGTLPSFYKTHADPHAGGPPPQLLNQTASPVSLTPVQFLTAATS